MGETDPQQAVNVTEFEQLAQNKMARELFEHVASGSDDEWTLRENLAAFQRIRLLPQVLRDVTHCDLSTTVLGQRVDLPVLLAPIACQCRFHPEGELAAARAAAGARTIYVLSTGSTFSIEEVASATQGPIWFQLYAYADKAITQGLVERAEASGYKAICLTVDNPITGRREADLRNRYFYPQKMLLRNLRHIGFNDLSADLNNEQLLAFAAKKLTVGLTWDDIEWLRSLTQLPLVLKGIMTKEDARRAVSCQAQAIIVSNHGGRQLDGVPASISVLEEIAGAIAGRVEILLDSGLRRGTDILKALALGAKAVLIGRPYIWGLAARGETGVTEVLDILKQELVIDMALAGCTKIPEVNRALVSR